MKGGKPTATKPIPVTRGSGNVFADLGLSNPDERLAKTELAHAISHVIKERELTQREAAALMGIDQPKVSHILSVYVPAVNRSSYVTTRVPTPRPTPSASAPSPSAPTSPTPPPSRGWPTQRRAPRRRT